MSRPKVGVQQDRGAFIVPKEREGGIKNVGSSRKDPDGMSKNYKFREKTTSPGMPRAIGASAQVHRTRLAGGKFTKL